MKEDKKEDKKEEEIDSFVQKFGRILTHAWNESVILSLFENHFSPKPANLYRNEEEKKALTNKVERVVEKMGGPPFVTIEIDGVPDTTVYDPYPAAAVNEISSNFSRCRNAVIRAHVFHIGIGGLDLKPEISVPKIEGTTKELYQKLLRDDFWNELETAFIRLASYWDRVGQLLDFVFFNIRQYERDGFPAVFDRISVNYNPVHNEVRDSVAWKSLNEYHKSEKEDGLKWLIRRRNLLIHSLHLRPFKDDELDEPIFNSVYNHLGESVKNKLKPKTIEEELKIAHVHLEKAALLFESVLDLCEIGVKISRKRW